MCMAILELYITLSILCYYILKSLSVTKISSFKFFEIRYLDNIQRETRAGSQEGTGNKSFPNLKPGATSCC